MAEYTARKTDTGAYLDELLGDLQTYTSAIRFVGKHQSTPTSKFDVVGVIDTASTGAVHVVLDCSGLLPGAYSVHWEAINATAKTWALPASRSTLEILETLR